MSTQKMSGLPPREALLVPDSSSSIKSPPMSPMAFSLRLSAISMAALSLGCAPRMIEMNADEAVISAGFYANSPPPKAEPYRSKSHSVLILTSGGADGAFGSGVINAWSASGQRPVFDVVAGVSTGALQAVPAFLGEDYDPLLKRVYTTTTTRDVFRSNGLRTLVGSGMYDPAPMRGLLREIVTEELLDEVASAHDSGRRLYVVTTDMTLGKSVFWDMGAVAKSGLNRRNDFVHILIASTAAPGLIEPVRIVDRARNSESFHGDGGVKAPVPLETFMLPTRQAGRAARVWVIANGHVSRDAAVRSDDSGTFALARRGVTQLIRQLLYSSVREAEMKASEAGARFHLVALPETTAEAANPFAFDPEEMTRLYRVGYQAGARTFQSPSRNLRSREYGFHGMSRLWTP